MIKPSRDRVLVKKRPRYESEANPLKLTLVDKKKHYDGVRRGDVVAVGPTVREVKPGDVVLFRGDSGYTFDYDPESPALQDPDNTSLHWLRESDCLALEVHDAGLCAV